ncbi:phosphatidylethanolamine-binding protein, partial [Sporodiniella umbellata]
MFPSLSKQLARCASRTAHVSNIRKASTTAYEEALRLIETDKKERLNMLSRVEKEISRISKSGTPTQLKALNALKFDLQVKSELNEPEVQKNFKVGNIDMSKAVYRYLRQKQFEKESKSKLMERLTQMKIVPDLLAPGLNPTVEVNINLTEGPVEPGVFIKPEQSVERPEIEIINFHNETRLYTLMLVDPDSPDLVKKTYQQHCHMLLTNVPLSATTPKAAGGDTVLDYVPPHPQKGTKYHRYTLIAFEQPNEGKDKVELNVESRDGFDVKHTAQTLGLKPVGATFFREEWDEYVSKIYNDVLQTHEPIYGKPPRVSRIIGKTVF